jgi:cytochrome c biogenesis protein CcmG/thiol:disulfide interchange protein DsbE
MLRRGKSLKETVAGRVAVMSSLASVGRVRHKRPMRLFIGLMLVAGGSWMASGAELKLPVLETSTEVYSNVIVMKITATDVFFTHSRGVGNAKLKDLNPELQKRFRYDPEKAAAATKQQAEATAQYYRTVTKEQPPAQDAEAEAEAGQKSDLSPGEEDLRVPDLKAKSFLGQPAPKFAVEKWVTPPPITAGKFVLVEFWATWCPSCRASIPDLNRYHARFKDRLAIIGLSGESEAVVRGFKAPRIDYALAIDPRERMSKEAEVKAIPHAILMDPSGIVRFEGNPAYLTEQALERLLEKYAQ